MGVLLSATRMRLGELRLSDLLSGDGAKALGQLTALGFGVELPDRAIGNARSVALLRHEATMQEEPRT